MYRIRVVDNFNAPLIYQSLLFTHAFPPSLAQAMESGWYRYLICAPITWFSPKLLVLAEAEGRFYVGIAMEQALLEDSWAHLMSSSMELEVEYVAVVRRSEHVGQFVFSLEWCVMDESDIFLAWNVILFFMELDSCGIFIKSKHGLSIFFVTS